MKLNETQKSIHEAAELIRELNHQLREYHYLIHRIIKQSGLVPVFEGTIADDLEVLTCVEFSVKNDSLGKARLDVVHMEQIGMKSNYSKLQEKVNKLI